MTLYDLLKDVVEEKNEQTAIIWKDGKSITYQEFIKIVNYIAYKIESMGIREDAIILALERTPLLLGAIFAVVASGNYYVPIDIEYPDERKKYIVEHSKASVAITDLPNNKVSKICPDLNFFNVNIDEILAADYVGFKELEKEQGHGAYCIYTSGSTGNPKGVMISEEAVIEFIKGFFESVKLEGCNTILCATTQAFDIFFVESIFALLKGLIVVLTFESEGANPRILVKLIERYNVDVIQMTPSRLQLLFNLDTYLPCLSQVKYFLIGGEPFPKTLHEKLKSYTNGKVFNLYGPTESTIWSSVCEIKEDISIGKPLNNVKFLVCDSNRNPLGDDQIGELYIGGKLLANGYYDDEAKTKMSFFDIKNERYYKSGDICIRENGNYYIQGRVDNQIKLNGFRIELEEIENVAKKCPYIVQCVAHPMKNNHLIVRIDLYYESYDGKNKVDELNAVLKANLPQYMLPGQLKQVDKFFYTDNGKIDRNRINEVNVIEAKTKPGYEDPLSQEVGAIINSMIEYSPDFNKNTILSDYINSIEFIQLIVAIEGKYGITFEDDFLASDRQITYGDFVEAVKNRINKSREKIYELIL